MTAYRFTVPGNPVPWQRAQSRNGQRFTARETAGYQRAIRLFAMRAKVKPLGGSVRLLVVAYRKSRQRCDWDNLGKTVSDALNGIAWADDSQVDDGRVLKRVDRERPRLEVEVETLEDGA